MSALVSSGLIIHSNTTFFSPPSPSFIALYFGEMADMFTYPMPSIATSQPWILNKPSKEI